MEGCSGMAKELPALARMARMANEVEDLILAVFRVSCLELRFVRGESSCP